MSSKKYSKTEDLFVECPYCRVLSIKLSAEEHELVKSGQQMLEVCQVCGQEVAVYDYC